MDATIFHQRQAVSVTNDTDDAGGQQPRQPAIQLLCTWTCTMANTIRVTFLCDSFMKVSGMPGEGRCGNVWLHDGDWYFRCS